MIIGIDATEANKNHRTGTEWYAYHLIRELMSIVPEFHEVRLYLDHGLAADFPSLPSHFHSRLLKWPVRFLWTQFRLSLEMMVSSPDLLFVPAHTLPLKRAPRTVITLHDVGFERFAELYGQEPIGPQNRYVAHVMDKMIRVGSAGKFGNNELDYHRFAARFAVEHASHIITVSEFSKKEIQHFYHVPDHKISVIAHGFDYDLYRPATGEQVSKVLDRYHISTPYIYYVGRLERKKNILGLVQGFHRFRKNDPQQHSLVLIGRPGYGWEEAEKYITQNGLGEAVIRPGYIPEEDLPAIITGARALVFVSFYEGFGFPLLHAMACGTPIVASEAASLPEVAGDAAIYVDPHDPNDIARGLALVTKDASKRQQCIEAGVMRAKKFTWQDAGQKTYHVLERVLLEK